MTIEGESVQVEYPEFPEIVFLYPYGLENGSSIFPNEFIYFTISGNLSLADYMLGGSFEVYSCWDQEANIESGDSPNYEYHWFGVHDLHNIPTISVLSPTSEGRYNQTLDTW